jgi:hypothetical protein
MEAWKQIVSQYLTGLICKEEMADALILLAGAGDLSEETAIAEDKAAFDRTRE